MCLTVAGEKDSLEHAQTCFADADSVSLSRYSSVTMNHSHTCIQSPFEILPLTNIYCQKCSALKPSVHKKYFGLIHEACMNLQMEKKSSSYNDLNTPSGLKAMSYFPSVIQTLALEQGENWNTS